MSGRDTNEEMDNRLALAEEAAAWFKAAEAAMVREGVFTTVPPISGTPAAAERAAHLRACVAAMGQLEVANSQALVAESIDRLADAYTRAQTASMAMAIDKVEQLAASVTAPSVEEPPAARPHKLPPIYSPDDDPARDPTSPTFSPSGDGPKAG